MNEHSRYRDRITELFHSSSITQTYLWLDVILKGGIEIHMTKSAFSDSQKHYERHYYNCTLILIYTHEYYHWTMQFSYYIHISIEDTPDVQYYRVANTSDSFQISRRHQTIHYTNSYAADYVHGIFYIGKVMLPRTTRNMFEQFYITITQGESHSKTEEQFLIVLNVKDVAKDHSKTFSIDNIIKFKKTYVYLIVTHRNFQLGFAHFPPSDVVVSYHMIVRRISHKMQGNCTDGFVMVNISFIS